MRFPTSLDASGSDAVNGNPDHSAAYLELLVDDPLWPSGFGYVFTQGRGNDLAAMAIRGAAELLPDWDVDELLDRIGEVSRLLVHDTQLRWLGPEKGVTHMAAGAVVNALWDIKARRAGLPLWKLLAQMTPEALVDAIDFSHLTDALTREQALEILQAGQDGKDQRIAELERDGFPAYTTGPGWLGFDDEKMLTLVRAAVADGFTLIKMKVAGDIADDVRRLGLARDAVGPDIRLAIDANQRWEVDEAIAWINQLREFDLWWVEEPTAPDDILGHARIRKAIAPVRVATGEAMANRIVLKQFLQAEAIDVAQVDVSHFAGFSENIANLLLAARFGVPVNPHAGGVGLCELAQHLVFFDYAVVSRSQQGRALEYIDHLHEHFAAPVEVVQGRYCAPNAAGTSAEMLPASVEEWTYPDGAGWRDLRERGLFPDVRPRW
ncbi:enolase C-terminal domain-like protein [Mycobacterium sp. NPDC003449]